MRLLQSIYLADRFFYAGAAVIVLYVLSFYWSPVIYLGHLAGGVLLVLCGMDIYFLFRTPNPLQGQRILPEIVTLNDEITVLIKTENKTDTPFGIELLDEPPYQTQLRDLHINFNLKPGEKAESTYTIKPKVRGAYDWGDINYFINSRLGLITRKFTVPQQVSTKVFPSIIQMRKAELIAVNQNAVIPGLKRMRKIGESMEFEQIRNYVRGDDYRRINWKATSRMHELRMNTYRDERSQSIYSVIDTGRNTAGTFNEMSLMDYAVNSALAISNAALKKEDQAGLITFNHTVDTVIDASARRIQISAILNALYAVNNTGTESSFDMLYTTVKRRAKQRSLLMIYTNFEHSGSLKNQLNALRSLARRHVVVVVLFENVPVKELAFKPVETVKQIYTRTIAEDQLLEKSLMVNELRNYGIQTVVTTPENLTINTLNKYLELKAKRLI